MSRQTPSRRPQGRAVRRPARSRLRPSGGLLLAVGAVAAAAVTALVVHRQARRAERDNPPLGRFVEVDGVRLHYVERGTGVPLVLLHGNGAMVQDFLSSGLVELAARRYRVLVFDRPGYGYSDRPRSRVWTPAAQAALLDRALQQLGVENAVVVGHSWGTLVALALARLRPQAVRALVLMSGYYVPSLRLDVPLSAPPAIPVLGDVLRYTLSPLLGRLLWRPILWRLFGPAPVTARFERGFPKGLALRPWQIRAMAAEAGLMIPAAAGLLREAAGLALPVVVLAGAEDRHVDPEWHSAALHRALPASELRLVPGAGHMVHHSAPLQVMAAIDAAAAA